MNKAEKARIKLDKTIKLLNSLNILHKYREEIKLSKEYCQCLESKDYKSATEIKNKIKKTLSFKKDNVDFF